MKTVLVTGADGMLGSELVRALTRESDVRVIGCTSRMMDVTDLESVKQTLEQHRPTHVYHCAAYTAVDSAEKEPLRCYMVNSEGTKNIAFFSREIDFEMVYISSDYVFPGTGNKPLKETDPTSPLNTYGKSKLLGEKYIQILCERYKIVRTSWLCGLGGNYQRNFIETMLRLAETRPQLSVVNDQFGKPTMTFDLAKALVTLLSVNSYGIYHVTNSGMATWYDFALKVFEYSGRSPEVKPVSSEQFRSLARRPRFSALENAHMAELDLPALPPWQDSLREYFRRRDMFVQDQGSPGPTPGAQLIGSSEG